MVNWWHKVCPTLQALYFSRDKAQDPRLGDIVHRFEAKESGSFEKFLDTYDYALIGFPEDRGVKRNYGRIGAAHGPSEIKKALFRLTSTDLVREVDLGKLKIIDLGDIRHCDTLEERQVDLGVVVKACLEAACFPIVLGGGHETAYGHFLGYRDFAKHLNIINCDAHLDVRPIEGGLTHSGTPFRQILETNEASLPKAFITTFGLQGYCNAKKDLDYAKQSGMILHWLEELRDKGILNTFKTHLHHQGENPLYLTICLDCLSNTEFPATSAAPPDGFRFQELLGLVEEASQVKNLSSLDLCEYSPKLDKDGQAAKRVALLIHRFLSTRKGLL